MPVLDREEYVEQAYFFRVFREWVMDGMTTQDVLAGSARRFSRRPGCRWRSPSC